MLEKNWKTLIKPRKLEHEKEGVTSHYGKFFAEPFERGFGLTIGNSLRRILLSSLYGAAVVAVKIDGVLHEFSRIDNVTEDVTDIVLNLKQMRFTLHSDGPKELHAKMEGEGELRAGDFVTDSTVEILTPDLHIATLGKNASLDMTVIVKAGRGFVPAEKNKDSGLPVDFIPVDAAFTPVKKVNYSVTSARVGQVTDYDRLVLEVWTDGSVSPEDAVAYSAKILKDQLSIFVNFPEEEEAVQEVGGEAAFNENLLKSIEELELSPRAMKWLKNANLRTIGDVVQLTEQDFKNINNFGKKSLNELKEALVAMGLRLGMRSKEKPKDEA